MTFRQNEIFLFLPYLLKYLFVDDEFDLFMINGNFSSKRKDKKLLVKTSYDWAVLCN